MGEGVAEPLKMSVNIQHLKALRTVGQVFLEDNAVDVGISGPNLLQGSATACLMSSGVEALARKAFLDSACNEQ